MKTEKYLSRGLLGTNVLYFFIGPKIIILGLIDLS